MKKYFLDPQYKKFSRRVTWVISLLCAILGFSLVAPRSTQFPIEYDTIISPFIGFGSVWGLYFLIRWILKALPK